MSRANPSSTKADPATVDEVLPDAASTENLLVMGDTLSRKDAIAFDLLADAWADGERPIAVTATDPEPQFRSRFEPHVPPGLRVEDAYVIDCLEGTGGGKDAASATCTVSTPADLTGIGICLSKAYDALGTDGGRRVLLDSLSTLLVYSELDRVHRFVSAFNGRVSELGDSAVHLLDTDALDSQDRHSLFQLFATVIEVRSDAEATTFRVRGDTQTQWHEYLPARGDGL